ncbi:hypothetical protein EDEG_03841 [Edhazardia aedis USNM 41457]|uniref:tRNA synthetases class I catalytic domain-containing protein n=1 Tax=Edhazardia aedis (strain USNM 41457) TaxID=1003232 RepID=J9D1B1_EDHAE|nr:hypothetical protein EDEG_03841 [Edhazardia aedis USNM 41457]|eukprot:EJW01616.1 hypothetical protein EDEG_03841 [Edhazardia aedis USNM 41457]
MENDTQLKELHFLNSITKTKEKFVPKSHTINWYICGPTVYDSPHIGHARTYISFDAIRSVLNKYFGYNVNYVMNITDIDDKIINKARENLLNSKLSKVNVSKNSKKNNNSNAKTNNNGECAQFGIDDFKKTCLEITKKYEKEFFDDLKVLKVEPPTFVTRVTEFMPEIESFIQKLVSDNLAYVSNGSVYFNINEYRKFFDYPVFVDKSAIKDEDEPETPTSSQTTIEKEKNDKENLNSNCKSGLKADLNADSNVNQIHISIVDKEKKTNMILHCGNHVQPIYFTIQCLEKADQAGTLNVQRWHTTYFQKEWTSTQAVSTYHFPTTKMRSHKAKLY